MQSVHISLDVRVSWELNLKSKNADVSSSGGFTYS
jgi:hypothetical protein